MADAPFRSGPTLTTAVAATQFTVPGGSVYTVRNIHVANVGSVDARFTMSIGTDALGTRIYDDVLIEGDGGALDWSGYMPLSAGEFIQAFSDLPSALTVTISGVDTT